MGEMQDKSIEAPAGKDTIAEGAAVPESVKLKLARNALLADEKQKATATKKKERAFLCRF